MDKVCVIMTTYNPKKYVFEQIESILNQQHVVVKLIIRDDGSTDQRFFEQISRYQNITLLKGSNIGVANNIMTLVRYAYNHTDFDFYAYSDQDDFWLPDKLHVAINILKKMSSNLPVLYYSNLMVSDEHLNMLYPLFKKNIVKNTYTQALAQVFCYACTCVFNRKMLSELCSYQIHEMGFDSLIYFIAIFYGNAYYDDEPHILYRQHGSNVSGSHYKGIKNITNRIKQIITFIISNKKEYKYNAKYMLDNMKSHLSEDQISDLNIIAKYNENLSYKIRLLFSDRIKAGYYPKDLYRYIRIIFNRY